MWRGSSFYLGRTTIQIRPIHPTHPQARVIAEAVRLLDDGGVVGLPTDTIYGLVCDPQSRRAVERIYRMRRLDERKPLALLCESLSEIARFATVDDYAFRVLRRLLPGPYCAVLPAGREAPRLLLTTRRRQVGLRIPDSPICQALLRALGRPLCVTSAIPSEGEGVVRDAEELRRAFPEVDLVLDGGPLGDVPSTILEIREQGIDLLREGKGRLEELERAR